VGAVVLAVVLAEYCGRDESQVPRQPQLRTSSVLHRDVRVKRHLQAYDGFRGHSSTEAGGGRVVEDAGVASALGGRDQRRILA